MIADQQDMITSRHLAAFRAAVAEMDAVAFPEPMAKVKRDAAASWVETFEREIAMWEVGIREGVPDVPQQPSSLDLPAGTDTLQGGGCGQASREGGDRAGPHRRPGGTALQGVRRGCACRGDTHRGCASGASGIPAVTSR